LKKFEVLLCRIGYSFTVLTVEAENEDLAHKQALEAAGDVSFNNESGSEYVIENIEELEEK